MKKTSNPTQIKPTNMIFMYSFKEMQKGAPIQKDPKIELKCKTQKEN